MFDFVFSISILILADRMVLLSAKLYGVGVFEFKDKSTSQEFESRYGLIKFPRSLFLILSAVSFSSHSLVGIDSNISIFSGCIFSLLWISAALIDVFKARKGGT